MIEVTIEDAPVTAIMSGDTVSVTLSEVGEQGPAGEGVPTGGTVGQIITKDSSTDFDTSWQDPADNYAATQRLSTGTLTMPTFEDNHDGTCTVSSVEVNIFASADFSGEMERHTVPAATLGPFTDGAEEYIRIVHNGGSPHYERMTSYGIPAANNSNVLSSFVVWRQGNELHSLNYNGIGVGLANNIQRSLYYTQKYRMTEDDPLSILELITPNPRTITVDEGYVYVGGIRLTIDAFNSSTDRMTFVHHVGGVWTYTDQLVYDNTQYDNGTDLVTMANDNRFAVRWFYRSVGDVEQVFYVLGPTQYNSFAAAALELPRTDLPLLLKHHCILVGRAIISRNATSGVTQSTVVPVYGAPALINHNDTLNIQGGVTGEHYHLTADEHANNMLKGDVAGGDYTDIDDHGHQTMHGDARAWRDALGDALSLRSQGPGVSTNVTESVVEFTASADLNDYLYSNLQLNHDRDETEAIFPHIHWFQAANNVPNFLLQYRWQKDGGVKATAWNNLKCNTPAFPYVSGTIHQICATASGIFPPSGSVISDIVQFRVLRDTGNTSGLFGADPYSGSVGILSFDTHIMVNSIGSDEQYLK